VSGKEKIHIEGRETYMCRKLVDGIRDDDYSRSQFASFRSAPESLGWGALAIISTRVENEASIPTARR